MKNKIKFINFNVNYDHIELNHDFKNVENPTPYKNLPDGEYLIRGDKKDYSKKYWVKDNIWYLIEDKIKDNGHYLCNAAIYTLFPQLSEKEWEIMNKIPYKRLSKYWQRARYGYNFYMKLREISRDARKGYIQILKKYGNN
jgi:hypothetical protein